MKKKLLGFLLASVLTVSMVTPAFADQESDLRASRSQAYSALDTTKQNLAALSKKQKEIESQISSLNSDIVDLVMQINQAQQDIESTKGQIAETETKIADTETKLKAAEADRDKQYSDMKKRIQYTYENGGNAGWLTAVLSSDDFASFINSADYASELQSTDRKAFEKLVETVRQVEELKTSLENQKASLVDQQTVLENQKKQLDSQNAELQNQKAQAESANAAYASQIDLAQQQAAELNSLISQQTDAIHEIEQQQIAAAQQAEAEAEEQEEEEVQETETTSRSSSRASSNESRSESSSRRRTRVSSSEAESIASEQAEQARRKVIRSGGSESQASEAASTVRAAVKSAAKSGASRSSITDYANKYVGGKYKWGGNSDSEGYDCSHFVTKVLTDTGHYSGGYKTSGEWASVGKSVDSLKNAKAGDVLVYSGHVSIYDGHGGQIEAQSSKAGITNNRRVNQDRLVAIRSVS